MPEEILKTELSDRERATLMQVQEQHGLPSLDEAARYLMKKRLRKAAMRVTGRNRAIYLAGREPR